MQYADHVQLVSACNILIWYFFLEIDDQNSALRSATETLAGIENVSAQATNRLAAAIEALASRLSEPIRIILEDPRPSQTVNHMLH